MSLQHAINILDYDDIGRNYSINNSVTIFPNFVSFQEQYIKPFIQELPKSLCSDSHADLDYNRNDAIDFPIFFHPTGSAVRNYLLISLMSSCIFLSSPYSTLRTQDIELFKAFADITAQIYTGTNTLENSLTAEYDKFIWLARVSELDRTGKFDDAIDLVFSNVNSMLTMGKFEDVSILLKTFDVKHFSINVLLAFLTITLCAKNKLDGRPILFERVKNHLITTNTYDEAILAGLD